MSSSKPILSYLILTSSKLGLSLERFRLIWPIFLISVGFLIATVNAQDAKELRWAADTESGAPYVFFDSKDPTKMTGFEFDIVQSLAKTLGMKPVFVQNSWDGLVPGLERSEYDIAINGIEITDERKKVVLFSLPYYATQLQIVVRSGDKRFKVLEDLNHFKVGTLTGALTEKMLKAEPNIHVLPYESEAAAHQDLALGRSDAVFFDAPIAKYYSSIDPQFEILPSVAGSTTYGIVVSKKNPALRGQINIALQKMIQSGELKEILERWGLWNSATAHVFQDFSPTRIVPEKFLEYKDGLNLSRGFAERVEIYKKSLPVLLKGAWVTIKVSLVSMVIAVLGGLLLVAARLWGGRVASAVVVTFIETIRGTPQLLQLFFVFYALPSLGVELSPFLAAVIGLGVNYSVQESEIYRSGLSSVHKNQIEAAEILGFNRWQNFWYVQAPQAFRVALPPMTTDFIALIKDSSLVSVITMVDLTKSYSTLAATYYDYVGFAVIAAVLYGLIGMPLVILSRKLEKRF